MSELIPLVECFGPTVQGEGALCGQISYFLRFGGCDYVCSWCDSMHAVTPSLIKGHAEYLTREQIIEKAKELNKYPTTRSWVTLSGGNPAIWNLEKIVIALKQDDMRVAIETQGSVFPEWFDYLDYITLSPKPPSSGMYKRLDLNILDKIIDRYGLRMGERISLKIVIFSKKDLDFAEELKKRYSKVAMYLSAGTPTNKNNDYEKTLHKAVLTKYKFLADEFLKRPNLWGSIISPQMHVLLWGHAKGK